ncbi:MAG: FAD-binding oxidoreductase [Sulfolobales archaeon]|nr:FAD-binding oxidoreductase [Sulfolobales archaeon]MCG2893409.1 FAD-binding oxidoreductase [Sulfolobales archaeon]
MRVVIVGGGILGSSLYILLKEKGHDVLVLDSGERKFYPTLIHSTLLKGKDVELAKESLNLYRRWRVPTFGFPSYTFGLKDRSIVNRWSSEGLDVREVEFLGDSAILGVDTDRLVSVTSLRKVVPKVSVKAFVEVVGNLAKVRTDSREIVPDLVFLTAGAWNPYSTNVKLPSRSYYCWAYAVTTPSEVFDRVFVYDYELGFYSRPLFGLGMRTAIVGDGEYVVSDPFGKPSHSDRPLRNVEKRLGKVRPFFEGDGFCEGTKDLRPAIGRIADNAYWIGGLDGYGAEIGPALAEMALNFALKGEIDKEYSAERLTGLKDFEWNKEPHEL